MRRTPLPYPGGTPLAASLTLSSGEVVVFDGSSVVQHAADGSSASVLGSFPSFVFPSFLTVDAAEVALYLGESTTGGIYRLFVGLQSAPDRIATLPFNYDGAVSGDLLLVSAATCGFGCGNELWRIQLTTFTPTLFARVPGASGPLAFDDQANLYYATAADSFPPPPGASDVWRFPAASLTSPVPLDLGAAQPVASGFEVAARLLYDAERAQLFLVENDFASGVNRLRRVGSGVASSPRLFEGAPFEALGNLSLSTDATDGAAFLPYQPAQGGRLVFTRTDFGGVLERAQLEPLRPALTLTGPGTSGPGAFTVTLEHGAPAGFARLYYAARTSVLPSEAVYALGALPLSFALAPAGLRPVPGLFVLDANGRLDADFHNPGGYEGRFALQALVLGPGPKILGSSTLAFL